MHLDPTTATAAALHAAIDDAFREAIDLSRQATIAGFTGQPCAGLLSQLAALQRRVAAYSAELAGRARAGRTVALNDVPGELR